MSQKWLKRRLNRVGFNVPLDTLQIFPTSRKANISKPNTYYYPKKTTRASNK